MTREFPVFLMVAFSLFVAVLASPAAQAADPSGCITCEVAAGGNGGNIDVGVVKGTSDTVTGRGDGTTGKAPGRTSWTVINEYITPACSGNGLNGGDLLCNAALTCPADNLVRFWVWHQVEHWVAGPPEEKVRTDSWKQEPGSYCLGADDPGITPIGRVIAEVQSGFQSLPLPTFTPEIRPAPSTLVNIPTKLTAGTAKPVTLTTEPLAGISVEVVATPVEWRWTFGDGTTAVTNEPSTTHEYRAAEDFAASVRVTWTGTFRIEGTTDRFPIRTPAYVQGPTATVDVREARSELVRD